MDEKDGRTALYCAAAENDLTLMEQLLDQGADVNARSASLKTPLHEAAIKNVDESHYRVIEKLLQRGAHVNPRDIRRLTPLFYLVERANLKVVHLFLTYKADFNVQNVRIENLLFPASGQNKNLEVLQFLIDLGLNVNHQNIFGQTPLFAAVTDRDDKGFSKVVELLVKNGADVNVHDDKDGQTPLYFTIQKGNFENIKFLLNFHVDVNVVDCNGKNLLVPALDSNKNDVRVVKLLIDLGINVNERDIHGKTSLHLVADKNERENYYEIAELLLKNGADVNAKDEKGMTPLFYFVKKCSPKIFQLLLSFNADISIIANNGETLLFPAVLNVEHPEILQFLINLGFDVNHRSKNKETPLYVVVDFNRNESHYNVAEILLKNGANVNARFYKGESLLHCLFQIYGLKIIQLFLKYADDLSAVDDDGNTLLFSAARFNKNLEVVQLLVEDLGLDVNHVNKFGKTTIHVACDNVMDESIKIVKYLLKNAVYSLNTVDYLGNLPITSCLKTFHAARVFPTEIFNKKLNFLMEHTDLSIFDRGYNNFQARDFLWWKNILENLAKLKSVDAAIHSGFFKTISADNELNDYFILCQKELLLIKNTKFKSSWITYFDLLVHDRKKLKNYAGNEDLIKELQNIDCQKEFPIYGSSISENVKKGLERRKLYDESSIVLSDYLPIFNSGHLVVRDILDCVLSKKDLSKLCR